MARTKGALRRRDGKQWKCFVCVNFRLLCAGSVLWTQEVSVHGSCLGLNILEMAGWVRGLGLD